MPRKQLGEPDENRKKATRLFDEQKVGEDVDSDFDYTAHDTNEHHILHYASV